jgi:hypothetical protein
VFYTLSFPKNKNNAFKKKTSFLIKILKWLKIKCYFESRY